MCHFVTAVLPGAADHLALDALARAFGKRFEPLSNPSIEARLEAGERYFLTTAGHCDCGTPLGALLRGPQRDPDWTAQEQRLLKKGWSKAKAARAIAQKRDDERESREAAAEGTTKAASSWREFIGAVLDSGKTPRVGLLLHRYRGSLEGRIDLAGREIIRFDAVTELFLGHMKEDVLYVFQR